MVERGTRIDCASHAEYDEQSLAVTETSMLHPFISTTTSARVHPMLLVSVALHAAIIFFLLGPTASVRITERPQASLERVEYAMLSFGNVPVRVARAIVSTQLGAEHLRRSRPHAVLADYHFALPVVAAPAVDEGTRSGTNELSAIVLHSVPNPPTELVFPNITYEMADVEKQAVPEPANPKPQYPASMQRRQVEARFAVSFVVDTSGHVDRETIEVPPVQHEEFARAVLSALAKWTFQPAVVAGHRVRERVKQPFFFRLK